MPTRSTSCLAALALVIAVATITTARSARAADIRPSPNLSWNGESNLVNDPNHPDHLVVAWMRSNAGLVTIQVCRSLDGGQTWSAPVLLPHLRAGLTSADPQLYWARSGTIYAGYIDSDGGPYTIGGDLVTRSHDGGLTWDTPSMAASIADSTLPADRPWLILDESPGPYHGRLYSFSKNVGSAPHPQHVWFTSSSDDGHTWAPVRAIDTAIPIGPTITSMAVPAIGADGTLYSAYLSVDPALQLQPRFVLASSTDGGATFTERTITNLPASSALAPTDTLDQFSWHLGAHPTQPGRLVCSWVDARDGDPDIFSCTSADGGLTWSSPQRVNDDTIGNGAHQDMCWGAWTPAGAYVLAWRDRRGQTGGQNAPFRIYASRSIDGGVTFQPNVAVSQTASPVIDFAKGDDFLGIALSDTAAYATWSDARGGPIAIQLYADHATLAAPVLAVPPPVPAPANLRVLGSPGRGVFAVTFTPWASGEASLACVDIGGRRVLARTRRVDAGSPAEFALETRGLPPGVYEVRVTLAGRAERARAVVVGR